MPQPNIPTVDLSDDDDDHLPTTAAAAATTTTTATFINLETPESIPKTRKRHRPSSHSKPTPITLDDDDDDPPPPKHPNSAFATTSFAPQSSPLLLTPSPGDDELICVRSDDKIGELGRNSCLKNTEKCLEYDVENRGPKLTAMENQSQKKDSDLESWLDLDSTICLFNGLSPNVHVEGKGGLGKRSIMKEGDTSDHDYEMENVSLEKGGASSSEDKANAEKIQNKDNQATNRKKLREEKNHKKEQERLRKANMKAEALRIKQLEKEKKMLERFKFSEKHIMAVIDQKVLSGSVGGPLITMFGQKKLSFETPENTFAKTVIWKLEPPKEISQLSSLKTDIHYILLIYDNAEEFCNHANDGSLMHHIASVRKHYPSYTICCLTNRLMSFINKREQQKYKNHKDARDWKRPPVEKLFAKLSIQFANIHIRQCADEAEVAEHVVGLTINLAKCHSRKKLTHLSVNANGCNVPKDCLDREIIMKHQWLKALVSIPKVQPKYALAIWKKYPTLKSLLRVYMDPNITTLYLLPSCFTFAIIFHQKRYSYISILEMIFLEEDQRVVIRLNVKPSNQLIDGPYLILESRVHVIAPHSISPAFRKVDEKESVLKDLPVDNLLGNDTVLGKTCSMRVYRILMAQNGSIKTEDVEGGADFTPSQ